MKRSSLALVAILVGIVFAPVLAHAQGSLARKGITELIELFAKSGAKQAGEDLAKIGGEKAVREILERAAVEGGDDLGRPQKQILLFSSEKLRIANDHT